MEKKPLSFTCGWMDLKYSNSFGNNRRGQKKKAKRMKKKLARESFLQAFHRLAEFVNGMGVV